MEKLTVTPVVTRKYGVARPAVEVLFVDAEVTFVTSATQDFTRMILRAVTGEKMPSEGVSGVVREEFGNRAGFSAEVTLTELSSDIWTVVNAGLSRSTRDLLAGDQWVGGGHWEYCSVWATKPEAVRFAADLLDAYTVACALAEAEAKRAQDERERKELEEALRLLAQAQQREKDAAAAVRAREILQEQFS